VNFGAGKTLALTYLAARNYAQGRKIYANYKLEFPFIPVKTPDQINEMKEGFFAADELWTWADSRRSGSKKNKFITPVLAKSRKRGIHIGYTTQYFKQIDIRIRMVTDFIGIPRLNNNMTKCTLSVYQNPSMQIQRVYRFNPQKVFALYDTTEEVAELRLDEDDD
jgi:hypothetical protein